MDLIPEGSDVARAIQLALAPVFLLTGIGALLNVMAGRLSRIIDRGRAIAEGRVASLTQGSAELEMQLLERRRQISSLAITACTIAALFTCMVIPSLFLEVMVHAPLKWLVALLFTGSTLALTAGLGLFLREVHLAMRTIRIRRVSRPSTPA